MSDRYFPNAGHARLRPLASQEALSEVIISLDKIVNAYPPHSEHRHKLTGFYAGPTSISLLFFALSRLFPRLNVQSKTLIYWSNEYLRTSLSYSPRNPTPQNCGTANERLTSLALVAVLDNDQSAVDELCDYIPRLLAAPVGTGSCEWLYGLSGLLYLLCLCRSSFPSSLGIKSAIDDTTNYILRDPQPWMWHGKEYLGAVHGTIGIIAQLVLSSPSMEVLAFLSPILSSLLATQLPSGNLPSSAHSTHNDVLVQFSMVPLDFSTPSVPYYLISQVFGGRSHQP
jgi:hypothetical protein